MSRSAVVALVLTTVAVAGCATEANYRKSLDGWVGASETQLLSEWGAPTRSYQIGDSTFVAFIDSHMGTIGGTGGWCSTDKKGRIIYCTPVTPGRPYEYRCETTFELRAGVVVQSRYAGNNCVAYEPRSDGAPHKPWRDLL